MNPELTGLAIVVLVLVFILSTWYGRARKRPQGPDVGVDLVVQQWNELREGEEQTPTGPCAGPLIWFETLNGAVIECSTCHYFVTTGNYMDDAHADTPLMREWLAS